MTKFLDDLGGQIENQFSTQFSAGENSNRTINIGDYASKIDSSEERRYLEEGYLRQDPYNTKSKKLEVLIQEPNATLLVKKKFFSSVGENFRPDYMDIDERIYYKAMQVLFANKCNQISSLEKLSKIQKITEATGNIDQQLIPIIVTLSDSITAGFGSLAGGNLFGGSSNFEASASKFAQVADKLRKIYGFNTENKTTTWITDPTNLFRTSFGDGVGVIEITNFKSITTTTSVNLGGGTCTISINDPYRMMYFTEYDIEKAIADSTNSFYNHKIYQFGLEAANKVINDAQNKLNKKRNARNASNITIKINPDTLNYKRVIAILDGSGKEIIFDYKSPLGFSSNSVTISSEYLLNGSILGYDGLSFEGRKLNSELELFKELIAGIYNKIQLEANSKNAFQTSNKNTNYARKKLRFNFLGKAIIQPMDSVHIYMGSKARYDAKLLTGVDNMFTGVGLLQNLNNTVSNFKNSVYSLFNPSGNVSMQAEKAAYVGSEFPDQLWNLLRGHFITEKEGTHVFGGVVTNVDSNDNGLSSVVSVRCEDNSYYFKQGMINFKPGVDNFNGSWFDPLTPFKSSFDDVTSNRSGKIPELLEENKSLLGSKKSESIVKHKLGPFAGQKVNKYSLIQDNSIDPISGQKTNVFYAPDGLAYKWKEGIGVFTQFGGALNLNDPLKTGSPNTYAEPFAGLDIMNVISLLITGVPYNFANYFKATNGLDNFSNDPQTRANAVNSYLNSLKTDLSKSNVLWGNFIPFKNLVIDEQSFVKALTSQTQIKNQNAEIEEKLKKLSDLNKKSITFKAVNILDKGTDTSSGFANINVEADNLFNNIKETIKSIEEKNKTTNPEEVFDNFYSSNSEFDDSKSSSNSANRRLIRRQLNSLTKRMSYNVRANDDKNLFIVDDYYDKDYDIAAYNRNLVDGIGLYNNDYTNTLEKIRLVAGLLNLEVFCDSQGHIRVRPPQYNRMPSSIFYKMISLKKTLNIQVFPDFLNSLFTNSLETLKQRVEIIEDQIRLYCAILSQETDQEAINYIRTNSSSDKQGNLFEFVSTSDGIITDISNILKQANPDVKDNTNSFGFFEIIKTQTNRPKFTSIEKYKTIFGALTAQKLASEGISIENNPTTNSTKINDLVSRIYTSSGVKLSPQDYLISGVDGIQGLEIPETAKVDVFKVVNDLTDKINERQAALKLFYATLKNVTELRSLDDKNDNTGNEMLTPGISRNVNIPEVFEHMIEDESYDDYGVGSGSRYVLRNSQILNLSISENPPEYTSVQVEGILNDYNTNALSNGLNSFSGGGNGVVSAVAIDYDMWRNYGFKQGPLLKVPFLSDPISQTGPYASILLSKNRKNIIRGTAEIVGNEFMQPGEVVFVEDRGMLFYIESVSHTMSLGSSFKTTLTLTYGHTPGEYIPSVMDMIGKLIYKNKDIAELAVQRQDSSMNDTNVGVIQRHKNNITASNTQNYEISKLFTDSDAKAINNILYTASYLLNLNNSKGNNSIANVELRIYYDKKTPINSDVRQMAELTRDVLIGARDDLDSMLGKSKNPTIGVGTKGNVTIVEVNIDDQDSYRSPSQKAISAARAHLYEKSISGSTDNDKLRKSLISYIIDAWIIIKEI